MSDPQPPGWNPQHRPSQPYDSPPPHTAPLPQYGRQPSQPAHPQYGNQQYGSQQYGNPPYGAQPQPPYGAQPQYGGPGPQYLGSQPPPNKPRRPWLPIAAVSVALVLVAGVVAFVTTRGEHDTADAGIPTATYSDAVTTPSADPTSEPPSPTYTQSTTPEPTPTVTPERRRTLKDIDKGLLVYDDVYVQPVKGWTKFWGSKDGLVLRSVQTGSFVSVIVEPLGVPAATYVVNVVDGLNKGAKITAVRKAPVKTLRPANSNIGDQAELSYTGRLKSSGITVSVVGRCTTMTGVDSIHNVTVAVCVTTRPDVKDSVYRDADRMIASVARSI